MKTRIALAALVAAIVHACPAYATLTSTSNTVSYTGNSSTTSFTVPFKFLASTDLVVTVAGATKTLTTDYTVTGAGNATGTVKFAVAPANSAAVVIKRAVPFTQGTSLRQALPAPVGATIETAFDRATMWAQQLDADRAALATKEAIDVAAAINPTPVTVNSNSLILSTGSTTSRTLAARGADVVSVKDFGAAGDGTTDDTTAIQAAINYIRKVSDDSGVTGRLLLSRGTYKITAPLHFGKDIQFYGEHTGFSSVIKPAASFVGAAAIIIDGSENIGGWAFRQLHRDYTVDGSNTSKAILPIVFKLNSAYSIKFENVWAYTVYGTAFDVFKCNDISFVGARVYGAVADAANSEYGIRLRGSGVATGSTATIIEPDIEVVYKGISQETDARATIVSPYMERNIIGWQAVGDANGSLTVVGGQIGSAGASGTAANIAGPNVTVMGGRYVANGGTGLLVSSTARQENVRVYNAGPDFTDLRNYSLRDQSGTAHWYPSAKVRSDHVGVPSGVATTFYTINGPFVAAHYGVVEIIVNARDAAGYSLWTGRYRFSMTNPDGTIRVTPVVEYGKTNVNASANYSLSLTVAATISGASVLVQITATTGGAIGTGVNPNVSTEAELVQWDPAGGVYVVAN